VYWTGDDKETLRGAANVMDESYKLNEDHPWRQYEEWNDGYHIHAPVGSFESNAFGLYDVHGNIAEWCKDAFAGSYDLTPNDGSPKYSYKAVLNIIRGGSYFNIAVRCRSSCRGWDVRTTRMPHIGVRPAYNLRQP
jgi:formylglycine-generating enzyme required for sulfatase activity